jgi:hypothetical protein
VDAFEQSPYSIEGTDIVAKRRDKTAKQKRQIKGKKAKLPLCLTT